MSDLNPPQKEDSLASPELVAHYRIIKRLGKGGMGEVFLAEDTKQHNRKIALKVLPPQLNDRRGSRTTFQGRGSRHPRS